MVREHERRAADPAYAAEASATVADMLEAYARSRVTIDVPLGSAAVGLGETIIRGNPFGLIREGGVDARELALQLGALAVERGGPGSHGFLAAANGASPRESRPYSTAPWRYRRALRSNTSASLMSFAPQLETAVSSPPRR